MRRLICVYLAVTLSCAPTTPSRTLPSAARAAAPAAVGTGAPATAGGRRTVALSATSTASVGIELVDGASVIDTATPTTLSHPEANALFARLEPLPNPKGQPAPAMRAPSPPPPRPGAVQPIAFATVRGTPVADAPPSALPPPRPPSPAATTPVPLATPEISPSGPVEKENAVRIRFSEPMVPVAAVGTSDKPVATIAPVVAGTWRWIDTRVATFTASEPYFANATEYVVTVPAGTRSMWGGALAEPAVQKFRTRPLTLTGVYPSATVRPDSAIAVQLDQAFDTKAVLPFLRVIHGKRALPYRVVSLAEAEALWAKNSTIRFDKSEASKWLGKHHLLIAPVGSWPAGSRPTVLLAKDAPSAEGPLRPARDSHAGFAVAAPFRVDGLVCADETPPRMSGLACPLNGFVDVRFSNDVDSRSYRSSKVQLVGEKFEDHWLRRHRVALFVPNHLGRRYEIAIDDDLVDVYGQRIVGPRRPSFVVARERFEPYLSAPEGLVILDPRWQIPQWIVRAEEVTALHVQLFAVRPSDYFDFEAFERRERAAPPGKLVLDKVYPVGTRHGVEVRTDLRPHLSSAGTGHLVAVVNARPTSPTRGWTTRTAAWLQVTKLGASVRSDAERLNAFVQDITPSRFLAPIAGAQASVVAEGRRGSPSVTTDDTGHASLELLPPAPWRITDRGPTALLQIEAGGDTMFTPFSGNHVREQRAQQGRWYVTDDRFTYKPGEKVYVKGWLRWTHSGVNPDLALPREHSTVTYSLADVRGNEIARGTLPISRHGGFDLEATLPDNANLGPAVFTFTSNKSTLRHPIEIQEFRRPTYAVALDEDVTHSGAAHLVAGEAIEMRASAKYYAGGGLPGAAIAWSARLDQAAYTPPGWSTYRFDPVRADGGSDTVEQRTTLSGNSDATAVFGVHQVSARRPSVLSVDATVTDVDRLTIRASSRKILVHPSTLYIGARLNPGTNDTVELIVTDIDGTPVAGVPIAVEIRAILGSEYRRTDAKTVDTQRCALTSSTAPVACRVVRRDVEWIYRAVATVADARGRESTTELEMSSWNSAHDPDLALVPDKASYRIGDVARVELRSKQVPAIAIVSFARQGVIAQRRVALAAPTTVVDVPIEPGYVQNVHVLVDRWADARHHAGGARPPLPEIVSRGLELPVELDSARLEMRARPLTKLVSPGDRATFEVEVKRDGKPQPGAEVALIVVDEAILALSGREHADPLLPFYAELADGTHAFDSLERLRDDADELDGVPGFERYELGVTGSRGGGGSGYGSIGTGRYGTIGHGVGGAGTAIVVSRKDFRPTAVFSPRLATDAEGKARVTVTMPDSLTRFRIVALATAGARYFGKAESAIVTQRKINARAVAPRFLSQGDRFSLPVVVQNLDASPRTIDVGARAANLVASGPAARRVTLQPGQRAEVRFDFAAQDRGKAVIQTIAVSGSFADASTVDVQVYAPATTEAFATYGIVDDATKYERLEVPANIHADVGGVEVEMASTQLQSLTDAFWYLYEYPFECAEQRSSRMIATTAMADLLEQFATPGRPSRTEIESTARADVTRLTKDQNRDGGWGYFDGIHSDPYVSAQVLVALAARTTPPDVMRKARTFVTRHATMLVAQLEAAASRPAIDRADRASHAMWVSLAAADLSALAAAKVDVRARAERLHATATTLDAYPVDAKARLLALVAEVPRAKPMRDRLLVELLAATHETAAAATVTTSFGEAERALLVSSNKTTALVLEAIMREAPDHALVPKLARGVLDARDRGRWASTQENLVVLQTLRRYFDTYERDTPSYTGKLWFGTAAYAEQSFAGRSAVRATAQVGWDRLPARTGHDLALHRDGSGRMYYRVGITYAPKDAHLPPLDAGFLVRRSYAALDSTDDVVKLPDGRIKVRLGARVRVTVEAINSTRRHAVALVDPLPAGFEVVNDALATSERVAVATDDASWDYRANRDTRVEVFRMDLPEGRHRATYTVRAATPGTFLAAPAKAEEMYSPETFGRSSGTAVVIE